MSAGTIEYLKFESKVLAENPLGDPSVRSFPVYLPPGYQTESGRYPVIFGLTGFTGFGDMYLNKSMLGQSFDQIFDELILERKCPPFIYVMPNCLSRYGGSQYVNSTAVGRYEDYIVEELVPLIDITFRSSGVRAVMGGSSGGIGAFSLAAKFPEVFQAAANHSGDSAFEYCYLRDVPKFVLAMEKYDYDLKKFIESIGDRSIPKDENFMVLLELVAMCACYCPNPDSEFGFDFPFDLYTGEFYPKIFEKMKQHDPITMVSPYRGNLKKLKALWVDCGKKDQFTLYLGARQLHAKLKQYEIPHEFEEYDSDHFLLRKEQKKKSIPFLLKGLS